ncbi:hypothetical protein A1353_07520 [Methylomonas methanica]|uniref:Uncharacterized protein n=1 Tax=Methylomonas methanica TaxID=421 RepID=A0A177MN13_METMH|nr:hypothetical protein [Methylomonas sp. ZR1]OAI00957.1 hypothetical protein A1332_18130 [Methylomonas methanica]OAI07196.1 hypothetical protein A1353_07520 [Methylomonas methanica]
MKKRSIIEIFDQSWKLLPLKMAVFQRFLKRKMSQLLDLSVRIAKARIIFLKIRAQYREISYSDRQMLCP